MYCGRPISPAESEGLLYILQPQFNLLGTLALTTTIASFVTGLAVFFLRHALHAGFNTLQSIGILKQWNPDQSPYLGNGVLAIGFCVVLTVVMLYIVRSFCANTRYHFYKDRVEVRGIRDKAPNRIVPYAKIRAVRIREAFPLINRDGVGTVIVTTDDILNNTLELASILGAEKVLNDLNKAAGLADKS